MLFSVFSEGFICKWFEGLRDQYTKLHKKKSGDGQAMLTERQQWVLEKVGFFNRLVSHRSKPVKSVSIFIHLFINYYYYPHEMIDMLYVIFVDMYIGIIVLINMLIFYLQFAKVVAENEGDLEGIEAAIIQEAQDVDDLSEAAGPSSSASARGKKRREKELKDKDKEDQEAEDVMQQKKETDDVISILKATLAEPVTEVTAYAQYIKMALVGMPRKRFKKASKAITEALAPFLDTSDESSDEDLPTMRRAKRRPDRTSSAPVPSVAPATLTSGDW